MENLFLAWREFRRGKEKKADVQEFFFNLEENIFQLYDDLRRDKWQHSPYSSFFVRDPKLRHIHKAEVRDRLLHHAISRIIEPIFDKSFIFDSYSSRQGKGVHRAVKRLRCFAWSLSRNNSRNVWILKADIRKFFDSVGHDILIGLISKKIKDARLMKLIETIIRSYETKPGQGIPLGNLTSQLFSNIYLNELDQFAKRKLRIKYYLRYADDFIIVAKDKKNLLDVIPVLRKFLAGELNLELHPDKISLRPWHQGIDFLGYVVFPYYTILRPKTKRRMLKRVNKNNLASYLGLLSHCRGYRLKTKLLDLIKYATIIT